jgi:hypothetical protein
MTDIHEARAKVSAHLKSDDFELEEFPEGWRVIRPLPEGSRGAGTYAVERATGNLLAFSSSVPPGRVSRDFEKVRGSAYVVEEAPNPDTNG